MTVEEDKDTLIQLRVTIEGDAHVSGVGWLGWEGKGRTEPCRLHNEAAV